MSDAAQLTDEELKAAYAASHGGAAAQSQAEPPGSLHNPESADIYGSDVLRTKAGFGNIAGLAPTLKTLGWSEPQQNKHGDLVVKGPNGKFYKDAANFTGHPVNWLESKVGGALPTAGMVGGGALGSGILSIPAAGVGGAAGEGARIGIGQALGTYQGSTGQVAKDMGYEGAGSAAAELGGKIIGKVPIPFTGMNVDSATQAALKKIVEKGRGAATSISSFLTGPDKAAYLRQLLRPKQVANALDSGNALNVARQAQDELASRAGTEGAKIQMARQAFRSKYGNDVLNTRPMISDVAADISRNLPNSSGHSGMTDTELKDLSGLIGFDLTTTKTVKPEVRASKVEFAPQQSSVLDMAGKPMERLSAVRGPEIQMEPAQTVQLPKKSVGELSKTADYLQQEINPTQYKGSAPTRSEKSQGSYQHLLGKLKDSFHAIGKDPNFPDRLTPYAAADARFHDFANKAKVLGPIENDATGESFASNLFGKNRGARAEAAQDLVPKAYEGMADIGARKNLDSSYLKGLGPTAPAIIRGSTLAGSTALGFNATHSLEGTLWGLGAGIGINAATSPVVHRKIYEIAGKYGMPVVNKLIQNPQLAPALLDSEDARRFLKGPWSDLKSGFNGGQNNGQE